MPWQKGRVLACGFSGGPTPNYRVISRLHSRLGEKWPNKTGDKRATSCGSCLPSLTSGAIPPASPCKIHAHTLPNRLALLALAKWLIYEPSITWLAQPSSLCVRVISFNIPALRWPREGGSGVSQGRKPEVVRLEGSSQSAGTNRRTGKQEQEFLQRFT